MSDNHSKGWSSENLVEMQSSLYNFKTVFWPLFVPHCEHDLNTLKFHLLDHLVYELERFGTGSGSFFSASPYEHFNFILEQAYGSTSKLLQTRKTEVISSTVNALDINVKRQKVSASSQSTSSPTLRRQSLVTFGGSIKLHPLFTF